MKSWVVVAGGLLLLPACNKNKDDGGTAKPIRVKTMKKTQANQVYKNTTYYYDADWRLVKEEDALTGSYVYNYSNNKVVIKQLLSNGDTAELRTIEINPDGYTYYNNGGGQIYKVELTAQGYPVRKYTQTANGIIQTKYYLNAAGEVVDSTRLVGSGEHSRYKYYTDKLNTVDFENFGQSFYGRNNKYAMKNSEEIIYFIDSYLTDKATIVHEYDSKGRIQKSSSVNEYGSIEETAYTYY